MKKIAIITDSSSGIKNGEYPNVFVLPLIINVQDKNGNLKTFHDQVDITPSELSNYLNSKEYEVKTSQASYGEIARLVESIQDNYDKIYVLIIPKKISGSQDTWRMVANDYPKLLILDNTDVSIGIRWSIEDLLEMTSKRDLEDQEVINYIENSKNRRCGTLFVYDLKQLAKGGRVSNAKSIIANLLNLKIIITLDYLGLNFYKTSKSFEKGVDLAFEYMKDRTNDFDLNKINRLSFIYPNKHVVDKDIELCENGILAKLNGIKPAIEEMPSTIISHTGEKMFAFYVEWKK